MNIHDGVLFKIGVHADQEYPKECCGLIVIIKGKQKYIPCRNIAPSGRDFAIHPEDYADAEDLGMIAMVVHSHPNSAPKPSPADLIGCEKSGLPWLIMNGPTGKTYQFEPSGYKQELYGREFNHGIVDCYTFVKDYYENKLNIILPDFDRPNNWWLNGDNLYLDNIEEAGFYQVNEIEKHDMIYMTVASPVPNHAAIYIGDGLIGHHQEKRLSSRDVYGGWYQKITTHIMRHKEVSPSKQ